MVRAAIDVDSVACYHVFSDEFVQGDRRGDCAAGGAAEEVLCSHETGGVLFPYCTVMAALRESLKESGEWDRVLARLRGAVFENLNDEVRHTTIHCLSQRMNALLFD